jgi:hypothetical protein
MDPIIQEAAEQVSENAALESSAVKAEAAAEATLIAAESAVSLANVQAAIVTAEAAETIQEVETQVEIIEGSLEWHANRINQLEQAQETMFSQVMTEMSLIREQIALLTVSPSEESPSAIPPNSEVETVISAVQTASPANLQNVDVDAQKAAEAPVQEARKKTKRFL